MKKFQIFIWHIYLLQVSFVGDDREGNGKKITSNQLPLLNSEHNRTQCLRLGQV